ncbi:GAF domain-containing protein [Streptomyces sp. R302]|uniref:sensor histidine kinase n=1 Tax=unclassified Streptomyces TaxID=2593676 RepID=UPI00145E7650|nr:MULTISPECIES: GAF domain-containing protein [unclassified Streptomyces]NML49276.1 GAF domain-containing protein [Streptomyces sp. R301]NML77603.1 GAF domain-containing protein [Streptomyces sp. R302]
MDEDVTGDAVGGGEREQARLPLLLEAVLGVGTDLELRATLQHIVDSAAELVGARHGVLRVVDPERPRLTGLFTTGMTEEERARVGPLPDGAPDGAAEGLAVPIRVHTQVFGTLHLTGKEGGFTEEDLALLRVLAAQAGIAIGNARLYETARQRERWIEGAAAVTTALLTGESAEDALMTVAEQARILADAAAGVILQPTPEGGMEIVTASTAGDPGELVGTTIRPGSAVLVQLLGGEPVFVEDSATDPRMTTPVRSRFGPSMMLPLRSGGRLIGTLALPRHRDAEPYSAVDRLLASQFASQAALALVLADARHDRERLAVFEDRDRIARDLHDLVVQRLFATEMMLESTRRRAGGSSEEDELLGRAVDELDSTIQEVRTTIFALQQPPAEAPTTFRGRVLRETGGAGVLLGFQPSVRFTGAVDALVAEPEARKLLAALRGALAAAHRRSGIGRITVDVGVGDAGAWLRVEDDGTPPTTVTWP